MWHLPRRPTQHNHGSSCQSIHTSRSILFPLLLSCLFRFSSSSCFLSILLAVEGLQNSILLFRHIMEHKSFTLFPEITWLRPLCRSCAQKELTGKTQQRAEPPHHMRSWRCFHVNLCKVSWDLATHYTKMLSLLWWLSLSQNQFYCSEFSLPFAKGY